VLIHLFIVILGAKISSNIYARDILNAIKINDPHAKLKTIKVRLAVRPCLYLIVTRAITKPAHQLPTHDASSAYHKSGFTILDPKFL
jgi:hypothetical protein